MSISFPGSEQFLPEAPRARMLSIAALAALFLAAMAFIFPSLLPLGRESSSARISTAVYPAAQAWALPHPGEGEWLMPAAAVTIGDAIFVADTGNNRILRLERERGRVTVLGGASLALQMPMAIATDGQRLFVANSLGANIVILDPSGDLESTITLPAGATAAPPRPIGLAVVPGGGLVVSDAEHHRVLRLDAAGAVVWSVGTGARGGGTEGFNVPAAVTVDDAGNIYVVDTLNARVVVLSGAGPFIRQIGERGDTAGTLARPKGVAVSKTGDIFVSDGLLAAVEVFDPGGKYLGLIGRREPSDVDSMSVLVAPAGISIANDVLLVTDRHAGLVAFDLARRP